MATCCEDGKEPMDSKKKAGNFIDLQINFPRKVLNYGLNYTRKKLIKNETNNDILLWSASSCWK